MILNRLLMRELDVQNDVHQIAIRLTQCCIIFLLLAGTSHAVLSQGVSPGSSDFKQVALNMRKQYENLEQLHIAMSISVFEEPSSASPYYHSQADVRKDKANYLYRFETNDMLMNDTYMIMVDRTDREIICTRRNKEGEAILSNPVLMNIDSVLSFYGTPELVGKTGVIQHFRLTQEDNLVSQIDLFINTELNVFKKIEYHYQDKQFAVIEFDVFDIQPQFEPGIFDEQVYISISQNEIKPSKNFSNYRVVNADTENEPSN